MTETVTRIGWIRKALTSGLLIVTPVAVTLWLLLKLLLFLDNILAEPVNWVLLQSGIFTTPLQHVYGPGLLALIVLLILIGWLARLYIAQRVLAKISTWIEKLPIVSTIFSTIQPLSQAAFGDRKNFFKKVVWVPFQNGHSLGFVVGESHLPDNGELCSKTVVFVPFSPPTTGMLVYYDRSDLIETEMSVEEGIKHLFSFGTSQTDEPR